MPTCFTLGAGLIGLNQARLIVKTWLGTEFGGGSIKNALIKLLPLKSNI
jgi:ribose 5-phosphate isomerase RpiB